MAEVLKEQVRKKAWHFWPADRIVLGYFAGTAVLLAVYWNQVPQAALLLALNVAGTCLILLSVKLPERATWYFHHWYPLPFVAACYREMAILIAAIRDRTADGLLADADFAIWRANPTVWLERLQTPALTEFLQVIYTLFLPVVLFIPFLMWRRRRYKDFRYCAFLLSAGFLISYVGYMIVPARGPRFFLYYLQHQPLRGLWLFDPLRASLDRLESSHYDCFPSGHVELTMLAWWSSRLISKNLFYVYFAYTLCIIFATVYLRYHYTLDLLAGALVAWALILTAPSVYRKWSGKEDPVGSD